MTNEANAQANAKPESENALDATNFEAELTKARDELLRALAEVENTRRRAERQSQEARTYAIDRFARDLLPVADTLTRALAHVPPHWRESADEASKNLLTGLELTERSLIEAFARHGLKRVGAKGETFDPNIHQAVSHVASEEKAGVVLEVMQPGYVLADRTLRPASVAVSAGRSDSASSAVDIKV